MREVPVNGNIASATHYRSSRARFFPISRTHHEKIRGNQICTTCSSLCENHLVGDLVDELDLFRVWNLGAEGTYRGTSLIRNRPPPRTLQWDHAHEVSL